MNQVTTALCLLSFVGYFCVKVDTFRSIQIRNGILCPQDRIVSILFLSVLLLLKVVLLAKKTIVTLITMVVVLVLVFLLDISNERI